MNVGLELHRADAPTRKATFFELAQTITELCELRDTAETEEDRVIVEQEIERIFTTELATKVDAGMFFSKHCRHEAQACKEFERQAHSAYEQWCKREEFIRTIIRRVMTNLGITKVKGQVAQVYFSAGRESLRVTDADAVPERYKTATVKMPLDAWRLICHMNPSISGLADACEVSIDTAELKAALQTGVEVPGAHTETGEPVLTIR